MKKFIAIIMALTCLTVIFASCGKTVAEPEEEEKVEALTEGDYEYVLLEDGTAKITGYNGKETPDELEIPSSLGEVDVTIIGSEAFKDSTTIGYVKFPHTITLIEERAFAGSSIKNAIMVSSRSLTEIRDEAFAYCTQLVQVDIPSSLVTFGNNVFKDDASLNIVSFRGNMENLSIDTFSGVGTFTIWTYQENSNIAKFGEENGLDVNYLD